MKKGKEILHKAIKECHRYQTLLFTKRCVRNRQPWILTLHAELQEMGRYVCKQIIT